MRVNSQNQHYYLNKQKQAFCENVLEEFVDNEIGRSSIIRNISANLTVPKKYHFSIRKKTNKNKPTHLRTMTQLHQKKLFLTKTKITFFNGNGYTDKKYKQKNQYKKSPPKNTAQIHHLRCNIFHAIFHQKSNNHSIRGVCLQRELRGKHTPLTNWEWAWYRYSQFLSQ
eukprot:TRINITY_DN14773_c0_g1_i4.p1 TRINITY_DN14773_c0_g1~~TRINITY_DN14773_c0_g1_i4.p1  ORF type:complete len:169 (+),score=2.83 TRINITY_DN14773_c0_g1_i4:992-1498(+)